METPVIPFLLFSAAFAATPERTGYVTDESDFIPAGVQDSLESKLAVYHETTGFDVAILTVDTLAGQEVCAFATQARKDWGLGGTNRTGVLYVVVPPPEKKACITAGPGAAVYLDGNEEARIVEQVAKPLNLQGKRVEAIEAATRTILADLGDTPVAQRSPPPKPAQPYVDHSPSRRSSAATDDDVTTYACVCAVIAVGFLLFIWWLFTRGNGHRGGGGSWGGGGGRSWGSGSSGGYSSTNVFVDNSHTSYGGSSWGGGGGYDGGNSGGDSGSGGGDGGSAGGGDSG